MAVYYALRTRHVLVILGKQVRLKYARNFRLSACPNGIRLVSNCGNERFRYSERLCIRLRYEFVIRTNIYTCFSIAYVKPSYLDRRLEKSKKLHVTVNA